MDYLLDYPIKPILSGKVRWLIDFSFFFFLFLFFFSCHWCKVVGNGWYLIKQKVPYLTTYPTLGFFFLPGQLDLDPRPPRLDTRQSLI